MSDDKKPAKYDQKKPPAYYKTEIKEFSPEQLGILQSLAGLGLTVPKIAAYFNMSKATFERRCHQQPDIADALEKGRAVAQSKVMKTAYDMAVSGKHPVMTIFWLKTQAKWQSVERVQLENPDGGGVGLENRALQEIANLSDEKLLERKRTLELRLFGRSFVHDPDGET